METITLLLFCITLTICIILDFSIVYALLVGLGIFFVYGLKKGFSFSDMVSMSLSGVKTTKNIMIILQLIGMLTALWRASGTIAVIIAYAMQVVHPSFFVLITFLLCCLVSLLMGTAFGSAATMGVICMTMANTMAIDPALIGGAVLAGAFFGDRCSPVSSSALLISELTNTNIFTNIKLMCITGAVPFILACIAYGALGYFTHSQQGGLDVQSLFASSFSLHWIALSPAIAILILSVMRIPVKKAMTASIIIAFLVCIFVQDISSNEIIHLMIFGFKAKDATVAAMLDGGGIVSMLRVTAIIFLSSAYAGIFKKTPLLQDLKSVIIKLADTITPFGSIALTSIITAMIACNQALSIMLTHQLCNELEPDEQKFAIHIENTAVVLAPLIPWSIAGAVPLTAIGAPNSSYFFACYLYILPVWILGKQVFEKFKLKKLAQ